MVDYGWISRTGAVWYHAFLAVVICSWSLAEPSDISSQAFLKEALVKISPKDPSTGFSLSSSDSFDEPKFERMQGVWTQKITSARWVHFAFDQDLREPVDNFESRFLLPISDRMIHFRTHLPVLVIDTDQFPPRNSTSYQPCFWGVIEPRATGPFPGVFDRSGRGGIKRRGSSSRSHPKAPLRLELQSWKGRDQPDGLLKMPSSADWILSPPSEHDPSLLRNALMYALSRECGQYAPRTRFIEVFFNHSDRLLDQRTDYFGVYTLTEKISGQEGRVVLDPDPGNAGKENALGLSKGVIFKFDRPGPGEFGFPVPEFDRTFYLTSPKESKARYRDVRILQLRLAEFAKALQSPEENDYHELIDAPSWHTWRWLGEMARNVDLYRSSSYFHIPVSGPEAGLIKAGPIWDFDRSLDSHDQRDDNPEGWVAGENWLPDMTIGEAPWWNLLLQDPVFRHEHCLHWKKLRQGPLSFEKIEKTLKNLSETLNRGNAPPSHLVGVPETSPFQRNSLRWRGRGPRGGSLESECDHLMNWLRKRILWLDHQIELTIENDKK